MSSQTNNIPRNSNPNPRQKKPRKHPNNNQDPGAAKPITNEKPLALETPLDTRSVQRREDSASQLEAQQDEAAVCFICAELVKYWAVSECNHRTCHVCALRLRALYKRMDCTFCKHEQLVVIFTLSPDKSFLDYRPEEVPFKDHKLGLSFETQDMMDESMVLLRFNCPDSTCDLIAGGWNDLKMHVRALHGKQLCDLCVRNKKVFSHEHILYTHTQLSIHLPSYSRRNTGFKGKINEQLDGGIHPFCDFCRESFFGDDELYTHMRERHEECFMCKQNAIQHQYFEDYPHLEKHFNDSHFPCTNSHCLAQKFVVFGSKLDLQAHSIETHGEDMSARDRKDARRVVDGIQFEQLSGRTAPGRLPRPPEQASSRANRREEFGAHLSSTSAFPTLPTAKAAPTSSTSPSTDVLLFDTSDDDPISVERHKDIIQRLHNLTSNSTSAVASVKAAVRSYRTSESGARDLISTVYTVLNQDLDASASILNGLVDLLEDEDKRRALLSAWNGFKIEQRRPFPDLTPTEVGTSYSNISNGRVMNVKQSTTPRAFIRSTNEVLDRVANAAARTSKANPQEKFPALSSIQAKTRSAAKQNGTPWSSSGGSAPAPSIQPYSVPGPAPPSENRERRPHPPKLSESLFPSLPAPSSTTALEARQLVNGSRPSKISGATAVWGKPGSLPVTPADSDSEQLPEEQAKKKKKGKEKQTLFTLGSFP